MQRRPHRTAFLLAGAMLAVVGVSLVAGLLFARLQDTGGGPAAQSSKGAQPESEVPRTDQSGIVSVQDYHHDVSPPLREMPIIPIKGGEEREGPENPRVLVGHTDQPDTVVQSVLAPLAMPTPILNFNGIPYPGVGCNCAPPDTDGEVGATQFVQMVNEGYQVFDKNTGASLLGPNSIESIWSGFGGACQTGGAGDPVVLYDQLANRWLISQFASATGGTPITDECVAISTSADATGSYYRYGFHLGSNFYDYPHLGVWPDAYYMSMNVFNSAGTSYLGPQPFAFDRSRMLQGLSATFISPVGPMGSNIDPLLPVDLDGSNLPTSGAPASFVRFPGAGAYSTYHFHVDFANPGSSTWGLFASPTAAVFTDLCPSTRACVPQPGVASSSYLDGIGDRLMFRLAYRKFADGHESVVGNYTVSSGGVAGVRWFELRNVTAGPVTVYQESTYQPDTTWRWMGSVAMDAVGDVAVGFSASSSSIYPQVRYAGRLVSDPLNQLSQGEYTLFAGTGSQSGTGNRWGDYSDMTVDPVDDCTFWYTQEYYATTSQYNWRTRIGNFRFPSCTNTQTTPTSTPSSTATRTPAPPTSTSTATRTNTPVPPTNTSTATRTNTPIPPTGTFTATRTNTPLPTNTSTATRTNTPLPANTSTATRTNTPVPPSSTSTRTPLPATSTPVPPTATRTNTPLPTSTATATATGVPPTGTRTRTPTQVPSATSTQPPPSATPLPPSPTRTAVATATQPPPPTSTPVPPTSTPVPVLTGTPVPPTPCLTQFSDVPPENTFYPYVRCLACRSILGGYADGTFRPYNNITRGQIAKIVSNSAGFSDDVTGRQTYADVPSGNTFWAWIERLTLHQVMGGYPCGGVGEPCDPQNRPYFRPFSNATRGQLSKIVSNAAGFNDDPTTQTFTDVPSTHPFYVWIERLATRGIMGGYQCGGAGEPCDPQNRPYFRPFNDVTRGQAAKIVSNTFFPNCETPRR